MNKIEQAFYLMRRLSQPERENTGVCGAVDALQTVHLQVREPVNKGGSSSEENGKNKLIHVDWKI